MAETTSIGELSSYQGYAALAGGDGAMALGQAQSDFSPVERLALTLYETNKINYEREEQQRKDMEERFLDPNINFPLDEDLAVQVEPELKTMMDIMKEDPQMRGRQLYKFNDSYKNVLRKSAQAKTVQAEREKYKKLAGNERDEIKKKSYENHLKQLESYKIGDQIPAYNSTFDLRVDRDLPNFITGTKKSFRINGNNEEEIEETVINPIDGVSIARKQAALDPNVAKGRETLVKGIFANGDIQYYNDKAKKSYADAFQLNYEDLKGKYSNEFTEWQKKNPNKTFDQFLGETGKGQEVTDIIDRLKYLKDGLEYIPGIDADGDGIIDGGKLPGFTYDENGMRLNVDDDTAAALISAINNPVGRSTKVLSSKLSTKPSEIKKTEAEIAKLKSDAANNKRKTDAYVADAMSRANKNNAMASKIKKQTSAISPLPPTEVPQIAREAVIKTFKFGGIDESGFVIDGDKIPDALKKKAGMYIMPEPPKGQKGKITKDQQQDYDNKVKLAKNAKYQMRFFDSRGNDKTSTFAKVISGGGFTVDDALKEPGITVKFIDGLGNVVGTTESVDRQTLIENNKTNSDKETPLGNDLPQEEDDF